MAEAIPISAAERRAMEEYSESYTQFDTLLLEYNALPWYAFWRRHKLEAPLDRAERRLNRALYDLRTLRGW